MIKKALLACGMLFSATWAAATPSIVSVTISSISPSAIGSTMTIVTTAAGSKTPARMYSFSSNRHVLAPDANLSQISAYTAIQNVVQITSAAVFGSSGAMTATIETNNKSASNRVDYATGYTTIVVTWDIIYDFNIIWNGTDAPSHKFWRLWEASGSDFVCSTIDGGQCLNEGQTNYPNREGASVKMDFTANVPYHMRAQWVYGTDHSCGVTGDGTFDMWQNGRNRIHQPDVPNCNETLVQYRYPNDNFCTNAIDCPANGRILWGFTSLENTFSGVWVSSSSTFATSTNLIPQPPMTWNSDGTGMQVWFNTKEVDCSTTTCYVYVTDAQNSTNANGFVLAASAGGGGTPTTIPQGIPPFFRRTGWTFLRNFYLQACSCLERSLSSFLLTLRSPTSSIQLATS